MLRQKFSIRFALNARASSGHPGGFFFGDAHLGRKQGVGVELLHFSHQIVCGEGHVLHKLAVQQEPIGAAVHGNALWDPPVPQAPHVGVALQEEPVQALFPDEPERHKELISPKVPPPRVQRRWRNPSNQTMCQAPSPGSVYTLSLGLHGEIGHATPLRWVLLLHPFYRWGH